MCLVFKCLLEVKLLILIVNQLNSASTAKVLYVIQDILIILLLNFICSYKRNLMMTLALSPIKYRGNNYLKRKLYTRI